MHSLFQSKGHIMKTFYIGLFIHSSSGSEHGKVSSSEIMYSATKLHGVIIKKTAI
jgi:hypothetical protein